MQWQAAAAAAALGCCQHYHGDGALRMMIMDVGTGRLDSWEEDTSCPINLAIYLEPDTEYALI